MSRRRVVPPRLKRLEVSGAVLLVALALSRLTLGVTGHTSLALSVVSLLLLLAALFYFLRVRPARARQWPLGNRADPSGAPSSSESLRFLRYAAGTVASVLAGAGAFTALGFDHLALGAALLALSIGVMAVVCRLRWPFE